MDARQALLLGLSMTLAASLGCSIDDVNWSAPDASVDAQRVPDAQVLPDVGKDLGKDALPAERPAVTPPDSRPVPDLGADALPPSPDYGVDPRPPFDSRPADAGYRNDAGWVAGTTCCLPCGDYDGCVMAVQTTPDCKVTVGSTTCLEGGTGPGSVWPQCRPAKSNGGCK